MDKSKLQKTLKYLGNNLRITRESLKHSQDFVEAKTSVNQSSISQIENGSIPHNIYKYLELCDFYNVNIADMLPDKSELSLELLALVEACKTLDNNKVKKLIEFIETL